MVIFPWAHIFTHLPHKTRGQAWLGYFCCWIIYKGHSGIWNVSSPAIMNCMGSNCLIQLVLKPCNNALRKHLVCLKKAAADQWRTDWSMCFLFKRGVIYSTAGTWRHPLPAASALEIGWKPSGPIDAELKVTPSCHRLLDSRQCQRRNESVQA